MEDTVCRDEVHGRPFGEAVSSIDLCRHRGLGSALLEPVITPRFVPTCTPELLAGLGELVRQTGVAVQSHISESMDEVAFATHLHPEVRVGGRGPAVCWLTH